MPPLATIAHDPSVSPTLRLHPGPGGHPFGEPCERRGRHRTAIERTVKLFDPVSGRYFAGHTLDASESGFCLELPARLPARAGQTACVFIAGDANGRGFVQQTRMLPIRYVWVRRDPATGTARCGVQVLADTASQRRAA